MEIGRRNFIRLSSGAATGLLIGCTKKPETESPTRQSVAASKPSERPSNPRDYFPTEPGTRWSYEIEIGETEPIFARETIWPVGDNKAQVSTARGRFRALVGPGRASKQSFSLDLAVAEKVAVQGPLQYPEGYRLAIGRDDLGIYENVKNLYWAVIPDKRLQVTQLVTYAADSREAPIGSYGMPLFTGDGYSMRVAFFDDSFGTQISLGRKPIESLEYATFDGQDKVFKRRVEPTERQTEIFSAGYTETMWFKKGVGLSRLEQVVNGKTSMVWRLANSTNGKV